MLKPSIFQLFLVAIPSPAKAGEICVIVDTELFAVGAACNGFKIRDRTAPDDPVCELYIYNSSFERARFVISILHLHERKSQKNNLRGGGENCSKPFSV